MKKNTYKQSKIGKIPKEWDAVVFADIAKLVKEGYKPTGNDDFAYIGLEHINQQSLSLNSIGHSTEVESNKFAFKSGDILFGKLRPYFRKVYRPSFSGICSTDIWVVRAKEGIDQGFLFYFMANQDFVNMASSGSSGTKMPRADWDHLKGTPWKKPPISEQRSTAKILSDLDEKIENNNNMNKTLETIGQALFKRWFVDFKFPGHEKVRFVNGLPEGWERKPIGGYVQVVGGSTPSTIDPSFWRDEGINWATPKDLAALDDEVLLDTERKITEEGLNEIGSGLLPVGTVLLSSRAPIGYLAIAEIPVAINQGFIAIICNNKVPNIYVKEWVKHNLDVIKGLANGTTFMEISKSSFRSILMTMPTQEIMDSFMLAVYSSYLQIVENVKQNKSLRNIRDSLLPKLMSGEIRVL